MRWIPMKRGQTSHAPGGSPTLSPLLLETWPLMNPRTFLTAPKPKRSDNPVVARGQIAWEHLKEDAPKRRALSRGPGVKAGELREQSQNKHRRWWREVGEALTAGKRMTKTSHEYYTWLNANGFGDMPRPARGAAIWFAAHIESLGELPDGMASPGTIRQWAYKRAAASSGPTRASTSHTTESGTRVQETLPSMDVGPSALKQATGNVADMQQVAGLLLEAAANMQRAVDLTREAAQIVQQSAANSAARRASLGDPDAS